MNDHDIGELWRRGRAEHPDVDVSAEAFADHVAALGDAFDPARTRAGDLYLACACGRGDGAALRRLDTWIDRHARPAVRRIDGDPGFVDEVCQRLRAKALVGDGDKRAKILDYAGRGPLATWLRVAAVRTGLNLRASGRERAAGDLGDAAEAAADDPELAYLKARYAGAFRDALAAAMAALDERERSLIRLKFADGLSVDQIGAVYGVHRATAARWLVRVREQLLEGTRAELEATLALEAGEFDSLLRVVRSQIDVSLSQILAPA